MSSAIVDVSRFHLCFGKQTCFLICAVLFISFASWPPLAYAKPDVKSKVGRTTLSGYTQVQFQATNDGSTESHTSFEVRRGRLQLEAKLKKELSLRIEFDATTTQVKTRDLYVRYDIGRSLTLKAGQLKKPFSYGRLRAARNLRIIERPTHIRKDFQGYLGRNVGLLTEWEPIQSVQFSLGIFNGSGVGPGAGTDNNDAKDFVGRVEFEPFKDLTLGLNASSHSVVQTIQDPFPAFADARFTGYGADVSCDFGNLKLIAEGLFADRLVIDSDAEIIGLYVTGVYKRIVEAYGLVAMEHGGRLEYKDGGDPLDTLNSVISMTPYVGFYFHSKAKIQINPILRFPGEGGAILEFVTQAQIEF
ncbi:MAG: porin [Candidatus Poribacteria bacterium]|nr:porin [Candidatus Poribacteria bacterium]MDE0506714.1 porin [Candidatus Poribacteria bacterium]